MPGVGVTFPLNSSTPTLPRAVLDVAAPGTFNLRVLRFPGRTSCTWRWEGTPSWSWELDRERGEKEKKKLGEGKRKRSWGSQSLVMAWGREDRWLTGPKLQPSGPSTMC